MEDKLSVLLHLVGCRSPASRCSVNPSFSTFVISRPCRKHPGPPAALHTVCRRLGTPSQARPQPLPTAAASDSPTQDVIPARGHIPLPMGSGIPHSSELRLPVLTLRGGGRARGAPRPQAKNKRGPGRARLRPRPSRAAGPRTAPLPSPPGRAKWRPRHKMAAG